MKINEVVNERSYTAKDIIAKQAKMAKQLQIKWATDKKLFAQQNKPITIVDYINRVLPVIKQVNPNFGQNVSTNLSPKQENNLIAYALDTALKATNYWQRQIEKNAGMDPSGYNAPTSTQPKQVTPTQAARTPPPPVGQAPRAPRKSRIPAGHSLPFGGVPYVWNGTEWRNGNTGVPADAKTTAALNNYMGVNP